jgi:hypothetical protein
MNAIEMQMIALVEMEAKPIAERYNLKMVIDWENFGVNFITIKELPRIELLKFVTEITAVLQKYPILLSIRIFHERIKTAKPAVHKPINIDNRFNNDIDSTGCS